MNPLNACKRAPALSIEEWSLRKNGHGDAILSIDSTVPCENVFAWILVITEDTYATI